MMHPLPPSPLPTHPHPYYSLFPPPPPTPICHHTLPRHSPHQSLQRLTQQFLNKMEIESPPEDVGVDRTENRYQHFMQGSGDGDKEGQRGVTK